MKKTIAATAALGLAAASIAMTTAASSSAADQARAKTSPTTFALSGKGFGTRVNGGDVPAGSSTTAFQAIGCTNLAGKNSRNHVAEVTLPGAGKITGVASRTWTTDKGGVVATHARASATKVAIAQDGFGKVSIDGVTSIVKAYHEDGAFKTDVQTRIGGIVYTDALGAEQTFPAPTPDDPIILPGLAEIAIGFHKTREGANQATAIGEGLRITLLPSHTRVKVARAEANIAGGMVSGRFSGRSSAIDGQGLEGNVDVGRQPLAIMPCVGTRGDLRTKSTAHLDLPGALSVDGLETQQKASQTRKVAKGFELGRVAGLDLGDGQLVVDGIVGKATVERTSHGIVRSAKGTQLGTITANGEEQSFPPSDVIEIPGVAKLERKIVDKSDAGLEVIALRITLLDGSGAVINLGRAKMSIFRVER